MASPAGAMRRRHEGEADEAAGGGPPGRPDGGVGGVGCMATTFDERPSPAEAGGPYSRRWPTPARRGVASLTRGGRAWTRRTPSLRMGRVDAGRRTLPLLWVLAVTCACVGVVLGALATDDPPTFDVTAFPLTLVFRCAGSPTSPSVRWSCGGPVAIPSAGSSSSPDRCTSSAWRPGTSASGGPVPGTSTPGRRSARGPTTGRGSWRPPAAVAALVLFPDRRPSTRLGRSLLVVIAAYSAVQLVAITVAPGALVDGAHLDNPFGIAALGGRPQRAFEVAEAVSWAATVAAMLSLVGRYRSATGRARQQLRWLCGTVIAFLDRRRRRRRRRALRRRASCSRCSCSCSSPCPARWRPPSCAITSTAST